MNLASLFSTTNKWLIDSELIISVLVLLLAGLAWTWWRQHRRYQKLRAEHEELRRQHAELAQLDQTKGLLFSALAHDVRSPLSSLYSLLTLLDLGGISPARLAEHKERLTRTLNATLQLLDSLLSWAATHLHDGRSHPRPLLLNDIVTETAALVTNQAERKHIRLYQELGAPRWALADPDMTRLVLRNLLSNAIKFTPEFGVVQITAQPQGTYWEIAVTDTGIGISDAAQPRIFDDTNLHSTSGTANERGIGLGLQLCKAFVERNGGQLSFQTVPGLGTTFSFTIPQAPAQRLP